MRKVPEARQEEAEVKNHRRAHERKKNGDRPRDQTGLVDILYPGNLKHRSGLVVVKGVVAHHLIQEFELAFTREDLVLKPVNNSRDGIRHQERAEYFECDRHLPFLSNLRGSLRGGIHGSHTCGLLLSS